MYYQLSLSNYEMKLQAYNIFRNKSEHFKMNYTN